ncbi:E3 ubiquitin-protein ligase MPSR1-like [Rhododendron vialii]|uniref:E3 ubiquitin-protein ligase MPSR1-like n=1 Tax=Rhododendron vialii TaxID=182163 RepID=UPI00265DA8CF|nr:E3 ubiquitin-protein ligase MPSR1-like [Rhododendron vialii]
MPSSEETPAPPLSIILGFSAFVRNPTTESVFLIEGPIIPDQPIKGGPLPASKASIEAMQTVKVTESGFECAICLGECGVGEEVKEMPCKHRYHSGCVGKWLGIHGSCPVCRYKMPVEEEGEGNRKGGDRSEGGDEIWVSLFVGGGWRDSDRNLDNGSGNSSGGHVMEA